MNKKRGLSIIVLILLSVMVMVSSFAFAPTPILSNDPTPTPKEKHEKAKEQLDKAKEQREQNLSKTFQREQTWLGNQETNLQKGTDAAAKAAEMIQTAKGEGKDVSALEAALSTFNQQFADAKSAHDQAAAILSAHNGFDADGKVTDPQTARTTVMDAKYSLRDAHMKMAQGLRDLNRAVKDWRRSNRPQQTPTAVSE